MSSDIEAVKTKFIVLKGDTRHLKSFLSGLDGAIWDFKNKQWIVPYEHKKVLRKEMKKPIEENEEKKTETEKENQIIVSQKSKDKVVIEGPTYRMRKYLFVKGGKFDKETKTWEFTGELDDVVKSLSLKGKNVVIKH